MQQRRAKRGEKQGAHGRLLGFARPTHDDPDMTHQVEALQAAGVVSVSTGTELPAMLAQLTGGDGLAVYSLDRLPYTLRDLVLTLHALAARGVQLVSLVEKIDTRTDAGAFAQVIAHLANADRSWRSEATRAGLGKARARGRQGGRPKALTDAQIAEIRAELRNPDVRVQDVCRRFKISRATLYKRVGAVTPDREEPR